MGSAHDCKAQCSLLFLDNALRRARCRARSGGLVLLLDASELFRVGKDEVHVLVEGQHLSGHLTAIHHGYSHPVVDVTGHLALFVGRHLCD